jgi:hypothetical protein
MQLLSLFRRRRKKKQQPKKQKKTKWRKKKQLPLLRRKSYSHNNSRNRCSHIHMIKMNPLCMMDMPFSQVRN